MKKVALFFGGKSVEHDISVITALQMMSDFPKEYKLIPIYIKHDGSMVCASNLTDGNVFLDFDKKAKDLFDIHFCFGEKKIAKIKKSKIKEKIQIDCALLCNHGNGGEDGSLQGALELCGIPYTSCNVFSSALTMDKAMTKIVLMSEHIDTPAYVDFCKSAYKQDWKKYFDEIEKISYPVIVKPARCGSSVGITVCENKNTIKNAIDTAFMFDDKIVVEKFVGNAREFCCAVVNFDGKDFVSKPKEVEKGQIFTFEEKYLYDKQRSEKAISASMQKKIRQISQEVYDALECSGVVRIDFLYDEQSDKLYVNEVNSIPGSLSFNMFETKPRDIVKILVEEAIKRFERKNEIVYKFNSKAIEKYLSFTTSAKVGKK